MVGNLIEYPGRYRKLLNCFEEFVYPMHTEEHALIESLSKFFDQKLQK